MGGDGRTRGGVEVKGGGMGKGEEIGGIVAWLLGG